MRMMMVIVTKKMMKKKIEIMTTRNFYSMLKKSCTPSKVPTGRNQEFHGMISSIFYVNKIEVR